MSYYQTRSQKTQKIKVVSPTITPINKFHASARRRLNKLHLLSSERTSPLLRTATPITTDESNCGSYSDISTMQHTEPPKLRHPVSPGHARRSPRLAELDRGAQSLGGDRIARTPPPPTGRESTDGGQPSSETRDDTLIPGMFDVPKDTLRMSTGGRARDPVPPNDELNRSVSDNVEIPRPLLPEGATSLGQDDPNATIIEDNAEETIEQQLENVKFGEDNWKTVEQNSSPRESEQDRRARALYDMICMI